MPRSCRPARRTSTSFSTPPSFFYRQVNTSLDSLTLRRATPESGAGGDRHLTSYQLLGDMLVASIRTGEDRLERGINALIGAIYEENIKKLRALSSTRESDQRRPRLSAGAGGLLFNSNEEMLHLFPQMPLAQLHFSLVVFFVHRFKPGNSGAMVFDCLL